MSGQGNKTARYKRHRTNDVDERVEEHDGRSAVRIGAGRYGPTAPALDKEVNVGVHVNQYGREHADQHPEVLEPETVVLEFVTDPALSLC